MSLNDCGVLTDNKLIAIVNKFPNLVWLDVRKCNQLTSSSLKHILNENCPHIKTIHHPSYEVLNDINSYTSKVILSTGLGKVLDERLLIQCLN